MLDEHHGQGGSYILDPETGVRRPVEPATPSPEASDNGTADAQTTHPRQIRKHIRN